MALTILSVGIIAVTGLSMGTAAMVHRSSVVSNQTLAAQISIESLRRGGFSAAASGVDTVTIDDKDYLVTVTVTTPSARTKQVVALVSQAGSVGPRVFVAQIPNMRPLPSAPTP